MTKLDSVLDGLHAVSNTVAKATARKKRINRDQVKAIMNIAADVSST